MAQTQPHIVILGAGFGGLSAAKGLANAPVKITLIDQQNHHLFQPLLYQVATAALTPAEIAVPIRAVLRGQENIQVVMDRVHDVDPARKTVTCETGQTHSYDQLIVATGAGHSYFGQDNWEAHAPGLKTLSDAAKLREKLLASFERAELIAHEAPDVARSHLSFVVIGAGPTGVEMAGAIRELANSLLKDFSAFDEDAVRVILLEAGSRVLAGFDEKLSVRAKRDLESLGVEVLCDTRVTEITGDYVQTTGSRIEARCCIWAAGVKASPAANWLGVEAGRGGHVVVDETLRPAGHEDVYVIGDTALLEVDGTPLPGNAPVAKQMGQFVAKRIAAEQAGQPLPKAFRYKDAGMLATIGRNRAVADIFGIQVKGFIGWALWGLAHIYFLIGFKNRLFVTLNWLWNYVTWQRGVRLIIGRDGDQLSK